MSGVKSFDIDLKNFAETVNVRFELAIKKILFDLFTKIVQLTPVDTGRARASWAMSEKTPSDYVQPEGGKMSGSAATAAARKNMIKPADPYSVFFIINNLPYIVFLEHGTSKQAPTGMVQVALADVEAGMLSKLAGISFS